MIQELFVGGLINVTHVIDDQRAKLPFSLLYATMAGHETVINGLVHVGADPSLALQLAFEFPPVSMQVVDRLLSVGANINVKNAGGETMLMRAASVDGELVHQLHARGADIEAKDTRGYTPIMFAAEANNAEAINVLRLAGANVHAQAFYQSQSDPDGVPPRYYRNSSVMIAAEWGNADAISALLLHLPAADVARMVNTRNSEGHTAVMLATQHKHLGAISILCQNGANTELKVLDGLTPVLLAVERGHWEAVTVLAMFGADVNVRTAKDGIPAIMMAANRGDIAMIAALRHAGADINATDSMNRTALQLSVGRGAQLTCETLLRLGANAHAKTSTNRTMLMLAAARGWVDIVHTLIGHDVDVNAVDSFGETALMAGARGGHLDVVRELIRLGADHRVVDLQGMSAAKHAIQTGRGSDEMMAMIGTDFRTVRSRFKHVQPH